MTVLTRAGHRAIGKPCSHWMCLWNSVAAGLPPPRAERLSCRLEGEVGARNPTIRLDPMHELSESPEPRRRVLCHRAVRTTSSSTGRWPAPMHAGATTASSSVTCQGCPGTNRARRRRAVNSHAYLGCFIPLFFKYSLRAPPLWAQKTARGHLPSISIKNLFMLRALPCREMRYLLLVDTTWHSTRCFLCRARPGSRARGAAAPGSRARPGEHWKSKKARSWRFTMDYTLMPCCKMCRTDDPRRTTSGCGKIQR